MITETYSKNVTMITEICCNCGIIFGMPSALQEALLSDSQKYFYCPNGHSQHYTKSKETYLCEQIERERKEHKKELEIMENKFLDELSAKNKLERKLKRVDNGVCPCCNRTFKNLGQHMKTKHPKFKPSNKKKLLK